IRDGHVTGVQTCALPILTPRLLRSYLAWLHSRGYARTTVARRLAAVRSWMRFLCRQGVLERNPAEGLRGPRQDQRLPHFLTAPRSEERRVGRAGRGGGRT